jgi:hypothetical protein
VEPPREPGHQQILRVQGDLGAESAAHARRDDVDLPRLEPEVLGDVVAQPVGRLRGAPHRQGAGGVVVRRRHAARLHRHGQEPLIAEPRFHDDRRLAQDPRDVAFAPRPADPQVRGELRMDPGRARREGHLRVGHGGERRVVDRHQLGGVLRLVRGAGDDGGDGLPHVAHPAGREGPPPRPVNLVERFRPDDHRDFAELGVDVRAGEDADDTGRSPGRRDVDGSKLGMGMRAADECHVERVDQGEIGDVTLARGEEPQVLLALERLANGGRVWTHGRASPRGAAGPHRNPGAPRSAARWRPAARG